MFKKAELYMHIECHSDVVLDIQSLNLLNCIRLSGSCVFPVIHVNIETHYCIYLSSTRKMVLLLYLFPIIS